MRKYWKIFSNYRFQRLTALSLMMLFACNPVGNTGSGDVLVRVYDKYLYASDLEGIVPEGLPVRDSLTMVRTYIQNWVDKELLIKKAEENLPGDVKDFSKELADYRNSLVIYEYEKMLLRQQLDTNINAEAVKKYYIRHKENFILRHDAILMKYVMLDADSPAHQKFRIYLQSDEKADEDSLAFYCSKYAHEFSLDNDMWYTQEEVSEHVPIEEYLYRDYLAGRRYYERNDSGYIFMIRFLDFRPVDSIAPVHVVEEEIKEMILNKRKNGLIKNMQQTLLQDAIEHNQVEIF